MDVSNALKSWQGWILLDHLLFPVAPSDQSIQESKSTWQIAIKFYSSFHFDWRKEHF